jgi:hypothetical protein
MFIVEMNVHTYIYLEKERRRRRRRKKVDQRECNFRFGGFFLLFIHYKKQISIEFDFFFS